MSSEVPRSKLPAYKPLHMRPRRNPTASAPAATSTSKSSCTGSQSELSSSVKASPNKELQNEIAKLKKELATVKTENSILKVKVRRVDDENIQKSRQIEKLRLELKAAQKVEPTNSKKNKDSELLLLRQKCLRLEGALREKDLSLNTFRKLNHESLKVEGAKAKQSTSQLEGADTDDLKQDKLNETQTLSKSSFTAHSSLSRSSQSTKSEVLKLRDMIHKLEKQNQDLQQQVKDKGEEIRCLKVHLRSQTYTKSTQPASKSSIPNISTKMSAPSTSSKSSAPIISSKAPLSNISSKISQPKPTLKRNSKLVSTVPNKAQENKLKSNLASNSNGIPRKDLKAPEAQRNSIAQRPKKMSDSSIKANVPQKRKATSTSGISKLQKPGKQSNGGQSNPEGATGGQGFYVKDLAAAKSGLNRTTENDLDDEAQKLRENIAAKKIQRGWRIHHNKRHDSEDHVNLQKAMTFIVTSIKHHKSRKEKLNMLRKQRNPMPRQKVENESVLVEAIQAATKNLWAKELNAGN